MTSIRYKPKKKQGELIKQTLENGRTVKVRLYKRVPKKCSVPKQLCIKCFKYIHKNDANCELKICKQCKQCKQ